MIKIEIGISIEEYQSLNEMPEMDRQLYEAAENAASHAYAPYSNFFVGAAIRLGNKGIHTGSNQENAVYPAGLCAERVALFSASALYPDVKMGTIAIYARPYPRESFL